MDATLRRGRWALCFTAALFLSSIAPARTEACSLPSDFLPLSNYELVRRTKDVVLARVTGVSQRGVDFEILEVLRGSGLRAGEVIALRGDVEHYQGPSPAGDFAHARPGAGSGGCVAYDYRLDGWFLLLLERRAGEWSTPITPFARVNEEVELAADPWLSAVRQYVRIASLADHAKERDALEALRERAAKSPSLFVPKGLAADIARHLLPPRERRRSRP